MTSDPKVSVIMPVFNAEAYLREAIESLQQQTFTDFELLIINDRSTDSSEDIIQEYRKNDSRIKLSQNRKGKGIVGALNTGLSLARSDYLARMDADDISLPTRLERQVAFLDTNPEVAVCGAWIELFGLSEGTYRSPRDHQVICCEMLFYNVVTAVMMRRSIIEAGHYEYDLDYTFAEDYELWTRISERHRLANVPEVLYRYRRHDKTIGAVERVLQPENARKVCLRSLSRLGINPSDRETGIHWQICNFQYRADRRFVDEACRWLIKIREANRTNPIYDQNALNKSLNEKIAEIQSLVPKKKSMAKRIFRKLARIARRFSD